MALCNRQPVIKIGSLKKLM